MLLGLMSGGTITTQPNLALQVRYYGVYFQDDWRVSKRLTLNLGLRWDSDRPLTERFNRLSSFNSITARRCRSRFRACHRCTAAWNSWAAMAWRAATRIPTITISPRASDWPTRLPSM